ncbi:EF-Tu/IF-2/RF-3 family GTPase [Verrucomicrobium sp. BvORR034]|uniref:EF-Tu/IF-2/RF-3 family GTPase n=1 Tax=Verrucomicrobium sp. BvORR034 TaxID=1396418 RepID=UPI0006794A9C|nr:EF-Tu/IF-2/RF-3 family GTPase [Verrucomicrobium sp. BvORR034]
MEKQVVNKAARKQAGPTARNACINHGKTTLSAAIVRVLSQHDEVLTKKYDEIDAAPEPGEPHITMSDAHEVSAAGERCVVYVVHPEPADYEEHRMTSLGRRGQGDSDDDGLTDACLARAKEYDEIDAAPGEGEQGVIQGDACVVYDIDVCCVVYAVHPEPADYEENRMTSLGWREEGAVCDGGSLWHLFREFARRVVGIGKRGQGDTDGDGLPDTARRECGLLAEAVACVTMSRAVPGVAERNAEDLKVMDPVDSLMALSERLMDPDILMPAEDAIAIADRGAVGHGRVERGILKEMPSVRTVSPSTTVTDIEMFRKLLDEGRVGDNVGLLLRGVKKIDVRRGQAVVKTGAGRPRGKVKGGGGRRTRSKCQQEQAELSILELAARNGCGMVRVVNSPTDLQTERQKPPFLASVARTGSLAPSLKVPAIDLVC